MTVSRLVNRNVVAERGRTSMRLEPELWDMLSEICEREAQDMSTWCVRSKRAGTQEAVPARSASTSRTTFTPPRPRSGMRRRPRLRSCESVRSWPDPPRDER